ncbi:hypothetical protein IAQ61_006363, partial [Plenodomus lingam]|uniref:Predicted protein n=1 Tax=Leptosphaeria maculans (strain JN3 / isolate v23.1.3 / race Av1-4-5-6-7-8) TaxID=985895 RepID=E4ZS92_LEPMJ
MTIPRPALIKNAKLPQVYDDKHSYTRHASLDKDIAAMQLPSR